MSTFLHLLIFFLHCCAGLLFFCRGFLLVRSEISEKSKCRDIQASNVSSCWMNAKFDKVVFIVIDALRYDFVKYQPGSKLPFHNQLKSVTNLLETRRENSNLWQFVADAPTTTLQRLKGITAGNLPTFIDAGRNFAGTEILEDNFIQQFVDKGKNITLLGDDTWISLYPTHFNRVYPFPSFDVHDLHTVDKAIIKHIYGELRRKDWTLLVAHFLGVDHCGHRYGPNHPNMALKLQEMDQMLNNVTSLLDESTILFVLGDHGMTEHGDHGGDTQNEINAALFAYSKKNIFTRSTAMSDASVSQTDLVPTLSLLMDLPIPFSNLGSIIPQFFNRNLPQAASANLWQVVRFASHYSNGGFGDAVLNSHLEPLLAELQQTELDPDEAIGAVRQIRSIFRDRWAVFNERWIFLGILVLVQNFLWCILTIIEKSSPSVLLGKRNFLKVVSCLMTGVVILYEAELLPGILGMFVAFGVVVDLHCLATHFIGAINPFPSINAIVLLIFALSITSNSYVVNQAKVAQYLAQTLVIYLVYEKVKCIEIAVPNSAQKKVKEQMKKNYVRAICHVIFNAVVVMILVRISVAFHRCREEQKYCENSLFSLPFASATLLHQQIRIVSAILCLILLVVVPLIYFKRNGHFASITISGLVVIYLPGFITLLILFQWLVDWLPDHVVKRFDPSTQVYPSRFAFMGILVYFVTMVLYPMMVHFKRVNKSENKERESKLLVPSGNEILDFVRNNAHELFKPKVNPESHMLVYGLNTAVTSYILVLMHCICLFLTLILSHGLTMPLLIYSFSLIFTVTSFPKGNEFGVLTLLWMINNVYFFGFGHQPTFTHLPIQAAFVGLCGTSDYRFLQATLITIHCFASHILFVFAAPLINLCNHGFKEDNDKIWHQIALLISVKALSSIITAFIHRRHLMVWKIFAPNFIYDSLAFIVSFFVLFIVFIVFHRAKRQYLKIINVVSKLQS